MSTWKIQNLFFYIFLIIINSHDGESLFIF